MRSRPTIQDVARRAGVSRQTVSRVLNNKGEVRPETRDRVLAAIEELNYRPNAVARSMVRGHTCTLGCISPSLTDFTFASIIEGAQAEARRQGYFILTGSAPTEQEVESLLEEFLHRQVDGLIVFNPYADGRFRYLHPLIETGIPVVYLGNTARGEPVSSVRCDDQDGGYPGHPLSAGPGAYGRRDGHRSPQRGVRGRPAERLPPGPGGARASCR